MAEPTEKTENLENLDVFDPEKIQFADIEEAKKKYFEVHKDLKKKGEKHAQEKTELTNKLTEYEQKLADYDKKLNELASKEQQKIQDELKKKGDFENLYLKEIETKSEIEKKLKDIEDNLKIYQEREKEAKKEENKKRKELLETLDDDELKEQLKEASLTVIQKFIDLQSKNPINSKVQPTVEPQLPVDRFKSELINESPSRDIVRKQVKSIFTE